MTHRTRHTAATVFTLAAMLGGSVAVSAQSASPTAALGAFGPAGSLAEARIGHTATLLQDGRVLVVGGDALRDDAFTTLASAELWDADGQTAPTPSGPGSQSTPAPSGSDAQETPAPSASAELDPALAAVKLLNMPAAGIRETCQLGSPTLDGQLAAIQCSFGTDTVVYASFDEVSNLRAAFESLTGSAAVEGGTSCRDGAFEGPYLAADGTEAGRVVCQTSADGPLLAWTDDRNVVLGFLLLAGEGGFAALHDHWLQVRLDAVSTGGPSPSPSSSPAGATAEPVGPGGTIRQWATGATASSQYSDDDWSATQATGSPDTTDYGDHPSAWAPSNSDAGVEWLELTYPRSVVPTEVAVWETSGAGALTMVEALPDGSATWTTLWKGSDPSPDERTTFSPTLARTEMSTKRLRLTIDTSAPGWNEIDAVELVGTAAP